MYHAAAASAAVVVTAIINGLRIHYQSFVLTGLLNLVFG
jgi:hypothetical protein